MWEKLASITENRKLGARHLRTGPVGRFTSYRSRAWLALTPIALVLWLADKLGDIHSLFLAGAATLTFAMLCAFGFQTRRRLWRIVDTPTLYCSEARPGPVELVGRTAALAAGQTVTSPGGRECFVYHWKEKRRRSGNSWVTIGEASRGVPFAIEDHTGRVEVHSGGATILGCKTTSRKTGRGLKEEETVLPVGAKVYVYGWGQARDGTADIIIAAGGSGFDYAIVRGDEEKAARWARISAWGFGMGALAAAVVAGISADVNMGVEAWTEAGAPLPDSLLWTAVALAIWGAVAVAGWPWRAYNRLVAVRQQVSMAWGMIDVELQRRHDLVEALGETVRKYSNHERQLQEFIAERWSLDQYRRDDTLPDARQLEAAKRRYQADNVGTLIAVAEKYPDLQAADLYRNLMSELTISENRLASARRFYNDAAETLNTLIQQIPEKFVAGIAKTKRVEYLR